MFSLRRNKPRRLSLSVAVYSTLLTYSVWIWVHWVVWSCVLWVSPWVSQLPPFCQGHPWHHLLPWVSSQSDQAYSCTQWSAPPASAFSRAPSYQFERVRQLQGLHVLSWEWNRLTPWVLLSQWGHSIMAVVRYSLESAADLSPQNHYLRTGPLLSVRLLLWG